ncbi:MAG: preprotein translocase subunit SecA [Methylotenera sp.]
MDAHVKGNKIPAPGVLLGSYPEKRKLHESFAALLTRKLQMPFAVFGPISAKSYEPFVIQVATHEPNLSMMSDTRLRERLRELRTMLSMHGLTNVLMAEVFAIVKLTCSRELGVMPYDTQLIAARIMLDGKLAEMTTGEGKTLAASICVATAALAGIPVHLITSNDYLVVRDSTSLRPLYNALGLTVGAVTQPIDVDGRKLAYACDITYVTAKELVFDYLRDHAIGGLSRTELHNRVAQLSGKASNTLLRGLCMAIVDEADSILIDEARVPLILSQSILQEDQLEYHGKAVEMASKLILGQDCILDHRHLSAKLTENGRQKIEESAQELGRLWHNRLHREETICQALAAQHLYHRDRHYLVRDDSVQIIDEITGRVAPGRIWSRGLHQLIETKEGCKPSSELVTAAQITYQRFFARYLRLGGMSGTLSESRAELFSVYGLKIAKVRLRKPSQRITLPTRIYRNQQELQKIVVDRVKEINRSGRPVLIGTDSVADSEALSRQLHEAGLAHEVLNARQDQREATIIASAGQPKQITVSTNMAGRGTDISLGKGIAELGGIHLIICQHNVARRIDRQLLGRCARQGNPGSAETLISMDKPLIVNFFPKWIARLASKGGLSQPRWLVMLILSLPQWLEEARLCTQRHEMMKHDARIEREASIPG